MLNEISNERGTCIFGVSKGVCTCNEPFGGPDCSIDGRNPPSIVTTELKCDGFCRTVIITGDGFFKSDAMQCEFTDIEVSGAVVTYLYTRSITLSVYWQFVSLQSVHPWSILSRNRTK